MQSQPLFDGQTTKPQAKRRTWYNSLPEMSSDRYVAVLLWMIGAWLSREGLLEFGLTNVTAATVLAFGLQICLTIAQRNALRSFSLVGVVALAFDAMLNLGGLYPKLSNIDNTGWWKAIHEAWLPASNAEASPQAVFMVALVLALIIAQGVEYLWRRNQ